MIRKSTRTKRVSGNIKIRPYDYSNLKVLIADDCLPMRAIMQRILRQLGILDMVVASDGREALGLAEDFDPDLIFMDRFMPKMNGVEVSSRIRDGEAGSPYTPIIMVSGHTKLDYICEARDAGINEFLAKPYSATLVLLRLQAIVANPRDFVRTGSYFGPDRRRREVEVDFERRAVAHVYSSSNRITDQLAKGRIADAA